MSLRHRDLPVAEQTLHGVQIGSGADGQTGEVVTQVMGAEVLDPGDGASLLKRLRRS